MSQRPATLAPCRCPEDKLLGCSRIAESNPHNARHLQPLHLNVQLDTVQSWVSSCVQGWLGKGVLTAHAVVAAWSSLLPCCTGWAAGTAAARLLAFPGALLPALKGP